MERAPPTPPPPPVRILPGVRGADKVWWAEASTSTSPLPASSLVLFFPGDRVEDASAHPDVHRLQSPGEVARLLRARFGPRATLVLCSPNRHEAGFACFDHFLGPVTRSGEPLGYRARAPVEGDGDEATAAGLPALSQAASLVRAGGWPPEKGAPSPSPWPPAHLVAFSKGGVVLNQALAELGALAAREKGGAAPPPPTPSPLLALTAALAASVASLSFIDVGLNGRGAYACPAEGMDALATRPGGPPSISLFGTRRQWGAGKGPQVAERDRLVAGLRAVGVPVAVVECGGGGKASLAMHFRCLEEALGGGAAAPPAPPPPLTASTVHEVGEVNGPGD